MENETLQRALSDVIATEEEVAEAESALDEAQETLVAQYCARGAPPATARAAVDRAVLTLGDRPGGPLILRRAVAHFNEALFAQAAATSRFAQARRGA